MAKRYRPVVRDQGFLLPPDMRDWLAADHPVWLVIGVVARLDTRAFHARRRLGGAGTAGYDPDMLLTVLVWAYLHGITSSRRMERLCGQDVAFRVICGGNLPDHATLARFRKDFPDAVAEFFTQVLILCAELGLVRLGTVALDGTKVGADASKSANRTEERLRKMAAERVREHAGTDAAEDDLFGDGTGDQVPAGAADPATRDERIDAALQVLARRREREQAEERAKAEEFRRRRDAGERTGCSPARAAEVLAAEQLERVRAAQEAKVAEWERQVAAGQRPPGRSRPVPPERYSRVRQAMARLARARERAAEADRKAAEKAQAGQAPAANITDPDSRLMPVRGGGFIQGYNAQNVASSDKYIIATELTQDTADTAWFEPMMRQAARAAAAIAAHRPAGWDGDDTIRLSLNDAGYLSGHNLTCPGPDRLIATGKRRDLEETARDAAAAGSGADAGHDGAADQDQGPVTAMAARLATAEGITAYRQRGHIAETPHGHIKHNMGIRRLSMRGKKRAAAEWAFICAVHNISKAIHSGKLTPAALSTPQAMTT